MLFALDWIKEQILFIKEAIIYFFNSITLDGITQILNSSIILIFFCVICAILLCIYGFRIHKIISGLVGATYLGVIGNYIGTLANSRYDSVSILYTVIFAIIGFILLYTMYQINIFLGALIIFYAIFVEISTSFKNYMIWISIMLSLAYCVLFIKNKVIMSIITGAIVLIFMAYGINPILAVFIGVGVAFASLPIQYELREKYFDYLESEAAIDKEKYPYGPGIVYGWKEPERKNSAYTKERSSNRKFNIIK